MPKSFKIMPKWRNFAKSGYAVPNERTNIKIGKIALKVDKSLKRSQLDQKVM